MIRGQRTPPYKTAGLVISMAIVAVLVVVYCQFRAAFMDVPTALKRHAAGLAIGARCGSPPVGLWIPPEAADGLSDELSGRTNRRR